MLPIFFLYSNNTEIVDLVDDFQAFDFIVQQINMFTWNMAIHAIAILSKDVVL